MPSSTYYGVLSDLERFMNKERSDNSINLGISKPTLYGKNADNYRAAQLIDTKNLGDLKLGEQTNQSAYERQNLANIGLLDQEELKNKGLIDTQRLKNIGVTNAQLIENEGKLQDRILANVGATNVANLTSNTQKEIAKRENDMRTILGGMQYGIGGSEDRKNQLLKESNLDDLNLKRKEVTYLPSVDSNGLPISYNVFNKYENSYLPFIQDQELKNNIDINSRINDIEKFKGYSIDKAPLIAKYMTTLDTNGRTELIDILKQSGNQDLLKAISNELSNVRY